MRAMRLGGHGSGVVVGADRTYLCSERAAEKTEVSQVVVNFAHSTNVVIGPLVASSLSVCMPVRHESTADWPQRDTLAFSTS